MKISFLIYNAYGIGGTIRSTVNLSRALSERHTVEIASVYQPADAPQLDIAENVRLVPLIDWRPESAGYDGEEPAAKDPSAMWQDTGVAFGPMPPSRLTDERVAAYLRSTDADVVIATRPVLNGYLARYGDERLVRIGQEHLTFNSHVERMREDQNAALAELDAFVTVSEADAGIYRDALPRVSTRILCIPNGVPSPAVEPSDNASKVIVAAGRLVEVKRYDRLIDAFAKVAAERPDWSLRIYGRGKQKNALRKRIDRLGLYNRVRLMGAVSPIETEWAKGAIAAVSSDAESFGMTIVEAMHCGVPVVATDCPYGPGEIITNGEDGVLVPLDGGVDAYAAALLRLIDDRDTLLRMAAKARTTAATYDPAVIAGRYERLIEELRAGRRQDREQPRPAGLLRRMRSSLRRALPDTTPAPQVEEAPEAAPAAPAVTRAHARATAQGGVTVRLRTAELPDGPLDFVTRLRRDPEKREIRLPLLTTDETGAWTTVTLQRAEHVLPEGRWDCYVAVRDTDKRRRLTAELVEQARLVTLPLATGSRGVSALIPYTTSDGYLALRAWLRPAHAEVEEVVVGQNAFTATAALHRATTAQATELTSEAVVVAASRQDRAYDIVMPARPLDATRFEFTLPYPNALARRSVEQDLWDLRLLTAPDARPIPIGRIAGDVPDRKSTDVHPATLMDHPERGATRFRPYFNAGNNLTLSARDHETED
ncbi:glycosyltransferase [Streptomyces sp. SAJ15]|uniref:glycosyltransferase n=1 Tax=Streptomyces sp. SAJ15 TaxID=2011095 RepID=UPI001187260A|nr:glycosyltransferase [Streptomyces sp. SAJ15]TVL93660.1 glycosyl transferase [Streptomyces sp. SAJ15]